MAATLQFVDSIASSPTLRLDINDGTIWLLEAEGTDFSPPALKTATADLILNDGATRSASAYENRRLKLRLSLKATSEDDKATKLRALHAELNRVCNFIKYQPGTTPLFFRTLRSPEYGLDETETYALTYVSLDIEAEPFAYGLRVDVGPTTLTANPAVANGCYLDVNSVTGDVETPALITLTPGTGIGTGRATWAAVRRHGTPSSLVWFYQAEAATMGTDAAVSASNDATASGGGNNYVNVNFATVTSLTVRLTFSLNVAELAGTYRVLLRMKDATGAKFTFKAGSAPPVTYQAGSTGSWVYVDIGLIELPFGGISANGYSGVVPAIDAAFATLTVSAALTSGFGPLSMDLIVLVPADEEMTVLTYDHTWAGTRSVVLDGPNDMHYRQVTSSGAFSSWDTTQGSRAGSIPKLRPGNNRLYVIPSSYGVTGTWSTTVSYWPRYLAV